ncbi:cyclin-A2-2-like [Gastrolobium bilobum]|uniref:cyclin-A2-2-like n=1 Tax=Gastrolobium bilobum TaxID=150636 RepID=UPI002AB00160|nr:cyclin-A2-2-like [Gastrolobium bilobum]
MNKENAMVGGGAVRVTRARTRAFRGVSVSSRPSVLCTKRAASDDIKSPVVSSTSADKSMEVLTNVTNICRKSHDKCIKAPKFQRRGGYKKRNTKVASGVSIQVLSTKVDVRAKLDNDLSTIKMDESHDTIVTERLEERETLQPCMSNSMRESVMADPFLSMQETLMSDELLSSPNKDKDMICDKLRASEVFGIMDIDSELKDSQVWSSYAPDIYNYICVRERERRPLTNYMDKLQQDITPSMRGILVDWLVEISEEYKLVPDTLYLTVNLIDRFLSRSLIHKQRLQLLGVTCMLISSKYEEIRAPQVEKFCFITDNTYKKAEVLEMEKEVLNLLHFQLSVPTTKTFLRRFIQAAQSSDSSYKVPCVELEFLANYLAELTLVEYSFLQFLPSLIAASAVLLARWTLNHSEHPWNPTLEHYTNYKVSELKTTVLALADLQLNTKGCCLNAIPEKYKQEKFKNVAYLSPKPVQSLFEVQV